MEKFLNKLYKELSQKIPKETKQNTDYWAGVLDAFQYIKQKAREDKIKVVKE